jgi:CheY-like chemotaxis protein
MNVLIVDDDKPKLQEIREFISCNYHFSSIIEKGSYQSGLKAIMLTTPDLILLDMSMPTYDPSDIDSTGGRPRHFAGLDILKQIKRKKLNVKVIVVTQFAVLGRNKEEKTLGDLTNTLESDFADYFLGTVFYRYSESSWKKSLKQYIDIFFIQKRDN